jgi:hypothetical protein
MTPGLAQWVKEVVLTNYRGLHKIVILTSTWRNWWNQYKDLRTAGSWLGPSYNIRSTHHDIKFQKTTRLIYFNVHFIRNLEIQEQWKLLIEIFLWRNNPFYSSAICIVVTQNIYTDKNCHKVQLFILNIWLVMYSLITLQTGWSLTNFHSFVYYTSFMCLYSVNNELV